MPRSMTAEMRDATRAGLVYPSIFIEATFASGPVYVWTGYAAVDWNGHTWQGLGKLVGVSPIEEGTGVEAKGITLNLSGIDVDLLELVLGEFQLDAPVVCWLGLWSVESGGSGFINSPVVIWAGRMDQPTINISAETATISINCESPLMQMNVAVDRRLTNDDQQLDYPGDRGLEFVNGIVERTIYFGRTPNSTNNV
jgi:hypothetical protein